MHPRFQILVFLLVGIACAQRSDRRVVIARASTLTLPFDELARELPAYQFEQESGGSRFLVRKLVDLQSRMDVLAVADVSLLEALARDPAHAQLAPWWVVFASNEMVLAYTPRSRYAAEINNGNWFDVLRRAGVSSGYANPDLDPEGYNTLLCWKLAEGHYHRPGLYDALRAAVPARNLRDHSVALLALLEAGELDYAWQYLSVARQHHLRYLRLPPEINLGDPARVAAYAAVSVQVAGSRPGVTVTLRGAPITYAATIPATSADPVGAADFIERLVSPAGQRVLRDFDQEPVVPARLGGVAAAAPAVLRRELAR